MVRSVKIKDLDADFFVFGRFLDTDCFVFGRFLDTDCFVFGRFLDADFVDFYPLYAIGNAVR